MKTYAVDFESYYSETYSIVDLGNYGYTHHPEFDAYMVSIVGDDGNSFVGCPKDFDWDSISGEMWISHNATFDKAVFLRLQELGRVSNKSMPAVWNDTADLVVYVGAPRALDAACAALFGMVVSKATRGNMKGKQWLSMTPEFQAEVSAYALKDSELCLRLWVEYSAKWPEWERQLSRHTREMCWFGMPVDLPGVEEDIKLLEVALWERRKLIPWADEEDAKLLSPKAMAEECRKHGVPPPKSMAKDSEDFEIWMETYGAQLPFAQAMSDYRRINAILIKLKTMRLRTKEDGMMPYGLKYGGAHTMRWSGDSKFNAQNLPRKPVFDVDLRKRIKAPAGFRLVVCDLSNIEPRVLASMSNDEPMLAALRGGLDLYEAHARATMGYTDPGKLSDVNPALRHLAKTRILGLSYGCSWHKFVTFAKQMLTPELYSTVFGAAITPAAVARLHAAISRRKDKAELGGQFKTLSLLEQRYWVNAFLQVESFRASNKTITDFWDLLAAQLKISVGSKEFTIELPSGRTMLYRNPRNYGGLSAEIPRLGKLLRSGLHGALLTENCIQATARDVFGDCLLRIEAAGYRVILHAHDEAVCLVKEEIAEAALKDITAIMSTPPTWMPALPQAAAGHICIEYTK